ncbi:MAG TPA: hypothetical protein V6D35_05635 [Candidatus Sericytochromatia bacterium]
MVSQVSNVQHQDWYEKRAFWDLEGTREGQVSFVRNGLGGTSGAKRSRDAVRLIATIQLLISRLYSSTGQTKLSYAVAANIARSPSSSQF